MHAQSLFDPGRGIQVFQFQSLSGTQGRKARRTKIWNDVNGAKLKELGADLYGTNRYLIQQAKNTDAWMDVRGTTVTVTLLAAK